jgi:hypothetical protein
MQAPDPLGPAPARQPAAGLRGTAPARLGAVAFVLGALVLLASTLLHPLEANPNDAAAAFAEYAAARLWIASHLGQFLGICLIGAALVALTSALREDRASAWAQIGLAGAVASVATAAALQAVDGIALKALVDRWAAASPAERPVVFEAAFAVRQVEIGLASLLSLIFGLTALTYAIALVYSVRYPAWLGWLGVVGGLASCAAGLAQAYTGFSDLAMTMSMAASALLLAWLLTVGVSMWRCAAADHGRLIRD